MNQRIFFLIYNSAEKNLKYICPREDYGKIVLPMVFIARLDSLLEESRDRVLALKKKLDNEKTDYTYSVFLEETELNFCNVSPHSLKDFAKGGFAESLDKQTAINEFVMYLDSFSPNVRSVLRDFGIYDEVAELVDKGVLFSFVDDCCHLFSQLAPKDGCENILSESSLTPIDNRKMGKLFELLFDVYIRYGSSRKYDYSTPIDISRLMSDLLFMPAADKIGDGEYSVYDGACGMGDTLAAAYHAFSEISASRGNRAAVSVFGQEKNLIISVVCRALMILRGDNIPTENLELGSTISMDKFSDRKFDFMISCPPLGEIWKEDSVRMGGKKNIDDGRFVNQCGSMVPRLNDSQFLFMMNNVSKMNFDSELGSRIVELHNGSPFNVGAIRSGENNARRYLIENDLVEAIIALPENVLCSTNVGTYIWILTNKKEARRKGKIQFINAADMRLRMSENIGEKKYALTPEIRRDILEMYLEMAENDVSRIAANEEFAYWHIYVYRPLRYKVNVNADTIQATVEHFISEGVDLYGEDDTPVAEPSGLLDFLSEHPEIRKVRISKTEGQLKFERIVHVFLRTLCDFVSLEPYMDYNEFVYDFYNHKFIRDFEIPFFQYEELMTYLIEKDPEAEVVYNKDGEKEIDYSLQDEYNVPFTYDGGVDGFMKDKVLPYAPDAWSGSYRDVVYKIRNS